jgi:phosphoadenosine phosphosulfate reductase
LAYEALQARAPGEKLYVAYSGGKDSECVAELTIKEVGPDGVEINYNATGIDPPEVVKHIKMRFAAWEEHGIECRFNKPKARMHDLIVAKGPPIRTSRYCCEVYKEGSSIGRVGITGVRWAESPRRKAKHDVMTVMSKNEKMRAMYSDDNDIRRRIMEPCPTKASITVNPIVDWTNTDVWTYIRGNGIPYCTLYDEGWTRLGCIGCPMADKARRRDFAKWPHMERYYRKALAAWIEARPDVMPRYGWVDAEDVWHWWMQDGHVRGQIAMEFDDGGSS